MYNKSSGILMPVSALSSNYGIGTFGSEAYGFVDFLYESGQRYWQLLPLGPVSYGDSPYSSFSAYAGNPYYIDLDILIGENLISEGDCRCLRYNDDYIDYEKQFNFRYEILRKAYKNSAVRFAADLEDFKRENYRWVEDYSLFMALKYENNQIPWYEWQEALVKREDSAVEKLKIQLQDEINFWTFIQLLFYKQYFKLKEYANKKGISLIGDMPIYVASDSVDVWAFSENFLLDRNRMPKIVAGVPPDAFSSEGQLWGNPVYDWDYLRKTSYKWWIERIKWSFLLYDTVRIDHFRGFDQFWAVPYGSESAVEGKWLHAYGRELFATVLSELGRQNIIAEDLGIITDSVIKLKNEFGFPGMKVLQFAFDGNPANPYLPVNYEENCVAYTGTHDNDTLRGWLEKLSDGEIAYVSEALSIDLHEGKCNCEELVYSIIRKLYASKANVCIIPIQDFLAAGSEARINTPSTIGGNWHWRIKGGMLTKGLSKKIKTLAESCGRSAGRC